jgi:PAS domain S-box-containing protein
MDWLALHSTIHEGLILLLDSGTDHLLAVAAHGISSVELADLSFDLDDAGHPLIRALRVPRPLLFDRPSLTFRPPISSPAFHVVPLGGHDRLDGSALGLMLVDASAPECDRDVLWACEMLGQQVSRLFGRQLLAETRFGQERMLLYSIINAVTDPILLTDTEGKLIIANSHAEKLFAAPDDASEGWRRAVSLNNMLFSAALSSLAMDSAESMRREVLLVDPIEGSDLLFELLSSRAHDERQGTYVVSILRNVTDLARAKEEIDESYRTLRTAQAEVRDERHRLELIIDSVADPILVTDPEGDIVLMNVPAEKLFMLQPDDSPVVQRRVQSNGAHLSSFVGNLLTMEERRYRGEMTLAEAHTGRAIPFESIAGTILSEQGELTWVVTILHDLTEVHERARLYEQLKQASAELAVKVQEATAELAQQNELLRRQHIELEQASALKSQFLANMSHEFRTPLNAILGYTHMLLQGVSGTIPENQRRSLDRIDSNSRHLLSLINDILDITRIEAGRMPLTMTSFGVPQLVAEVVSELEPIIKRSNLSVTSEIRQGLPMLRSDRQKVKQIVLNLLSNALKFTPDGSVRIRATYDAESRTLAVEVADTGIGISADDQARVFEDFRQLDTSPTRGYGGTGLGLSICRRLATMLGGSIELQSEIGRGSVFTLQLPVRPKRR